MRESSIVLLPISFQTSVIEEVSEEEPSACGKWCFTLDR